MILISKARHQRDMAALLAEIDQLTHERDSAIADLDALKAAPPAARDLTDITDAVRTIEGGRLRPRTPSAELLQARAHNRALDARLTVLTAASINCTCGAAA
ncbi:hypothetical protein [Streptomyces sp. NPDC059597]|uniref:hypothetical protein n=1 Tax=Streptomyces sp. NPDC059597 TaxID=3346879 RepID=UPI0036C1B4A3